MAGVQNSHGPRSQCAHSASTNKLTTPGFIYDAAGNFLAGYSGGAWNAGVWMGARQLAMYGWGTGQPAYFTHANALNSATTATDATGAPAGEILYYPWGQTWEDPGGFFGVTAYQPWAAMLEYDTSVPDYETPFRGYYPTLGRWMSPDPMAGDISNPQSLNRYAYALNNPTSLVDPLGLDPCDSQDYSEPCDPCGDAFWQLLDIGCMPAGPGGLAPFPPIPPGGGGGGGPATGNAQNPPPNTSGIDPAAPCGRDSVGEPLPCPPWWPLLLPPAAAASTFIGPQSQPQPQPQKPDTRPSCISVLGNSLFFGNPGQEQAITQGTNAVSQSFAAASLRYQMKRLLVVPLRSVYVRGMNGVADILGIASDASPYLFLGAPIVQAEYISARANLTGACQNNFWSSIF